MAKETEEKREREKDDYVEKRGEAARKREGGEEGQTEDE